MIVEFAAELWVWEARREESWTFVSLPVGVSEEIRERTGGMRRGFGSVRVRVRVGTSSWNTSIFPDSGRGAFVLPIKKSVRRAERLDAGDTATVELEVLGIEA
ncbi:DUF1905 domain-containing protein [Actinoplanes sp. NPDC051851]|uniref:DUF1905 domain-containing protein n=1 Tax=Actinoplanes sp. NPDC051851 TaxID=3154753 RepID=UPI00344666D1